MVDARGNDGEEIELQMPSKTEVSELVVKSEYQYRKLIEKARRIPDIDYEVRKMGVGLELRNPTKMELGCWALTLVPWIGGRIISMTHIPSGRQWLESRVDFGGYEEYSGTEYRSPGCSEDYSIIRRSTQESEEEYLEMEGDIGGGLTVQRRISILNHDPTAIHINSSIFARSVGAGSGGFSRLVRLRVHPTFALLNPSQVHIAFTSLEGNKCEIWPESGEKYFEGNLRPNGEWRLVDPCAGVALVNQFEMGQVEQCMIHWGAGTVNMELWSEERPVSKLTPLSISHHYHVLPLTAKPIIPSL